MKIIPIKNDSATILQRFLLSSEVFFADILGCVDYLGCFLLIIWGALIILDASGIMIAIFITAMIHFNISVGGPGIRAFFSLLLVFSYFLASPELKRFYYKE